MSPVPVKTSGVHHVALTVPDLDAAKAFFIDLLGHTQVGEAPDYPAVFVSDGAVMVTLWQAEDPSQAVSFDRRCNIGLHHLALRVADADALDALHDQLARRPDVSVEFAPEPLGDTSWRHMMCRMPGGIRLEFVA